MKVSLYSILLLALVPAVLQSQDAPLTTAGRVTNASPGDMSVPVAVTVTDFTDIGQFTLTLKFDTTKVRFVAANPNVNLNGMSVSYTAPSAGSTQGKLVLAWTGTSNQTLNDSTALADLVFHYVTGTGIFYWSYTFGSVCLYKRWVNGSLTALADNPKYMFYFNGGISNRTAPFVNAPVIADPVAGALPVSIIVNSFNTIGNFTLSLVYDPSIITYLNSFTKNAAFGSTFQVGDNAGPDNNRTIVIQWYGGSVTLSDSSTLCTLNFSYPNANCDPTALAWLDSGPTCEYNDNLGNVLIDMPQQTFYSDGIVASGMQSTWTGNTGSDWNNPLNWNDCGVPDSTRKAIIPAVPEGTNPIITASGYCESIEIEAGASLIIGTNGFLSIGIINDE